MILNDLENVVLQAKMKHKILDDLERDLRKSNPDDIFDKYKKIIEENINKLSTRKIVKEEKFYRGRIGKKVILGAIDDLNTEFEIPFFNKEISAPSPIICKEGRFNRAGYSFLYLASDEKTCCAEIKLEVGQIASIGIFECTKEGEYIDLSISTSNEFMENVKEKLLTPIHTEIKYLYQITQLISDIFRKLDYSGIIYESTVTKGENIVVFNPDNFRFVEHSDKFYTAIKIDYSVEEVKEKHHNYVDFEKLLNGYNQHEEDEKERNIEYIREKFNRLKTTNKKEENNE